MSMMFTHMKPWLAENINSVEIVNEYIMLVNLVLITCYTKFVSNPEYQFLAGWF